MTNRDSPAGRRDVAALAGYHARKSTGHIAMTTFDVFTSWVAWPFWAVTVAGVAFWAWEKATGNEP